MKAAPLTTPRVEDSEALLAPVEAELQPEALLQVVETGRPGIDLLRFVAVFAIVWFHAGGAFTEALSFRLPAVALITSLVQSRTRQWHPRAVLIPWAFWSAVYAIAMGVRVYHHGWEVVPPWMTFPKVIAAGGPALHLWYAPVALAAGALAHVVRRLNRGWLLCLTACAFALTSVTQELPFPYSQWMLVLPTIPAGILLAGEVELMDVALIAGMGAAGGGLRFLIAVPLVWLAAQWKGPRFKSLATLSRGIYWSHVLIILFVAKWMAPFDDPVMSLFLTVLLSMALMLSARTRKVL